MSDKYYVGKRASNLVESPSLLPYSKVVIVVGEDEDGVQVSYEAGDDSGKTLEISNPWGTQQMANDLIARLRGYSYKPFDAADAEISDDADLGDAVTVGGTYSVIVKQDLIFDELGLSDIAAPSASEDDNEFENKENGMSYVDRIVNRRVSRLTTRFSVERGKIETEIQDLDSELSSRITQTAESLETELQNTADGLSTRITQNANSITAHSSAINELNEEISTTVSLNAQGIMISNATGQKFKINTQNNISMSFGDLNDSTNKQNEIDRANDLADDAMSEASSASRQASNVDRALEALKTNIGYTYIDSQYVISPNIVGGSLKSQSGNSVVHIYNGQIDFSPRGTITDARIFFNPLIGSGEFVIASDIYKISISSIVGTELGDKIFLSAKGVYGSYGTELPDYGSEGQLFFLIK